MDRHVFSTAGNSQLKTKKHAKDLSMCTHHSTPSFWLRACQLSLADSTLKCDKWVAEKWWAGRLAHLTKHPSFEGAFMNKSYQQLTEDERIDIYAMRQEGKTVPQMANALEREKESAMGRRFEETNMSNSESGDHWLLDPNGDLHLRDDEGSISEHLSKMKW
jgi:hypothetical protein